jgi:hypothetical protein
MPLTAGELRATRLIYTRFDLDHNEMIDRAEFRDFIKVMLKFDLRSFKEDDELPENLEKLELSDEDVDWMFNSMDVNNDGYASYDEVTRCFAAVKDRDVTYLVMMSFRGLDRNRRRRLVLSELPKEVGIYQARMPKADFVQKAKKLYKGCDKLNFSQFFKVLTDGDIPDDFDPYEGELRTCCACVIS